MNVIKFANPGYLWLLLLLLPAIAWYIFKQYRSHAALTISTFNGFNTKIISYRYYLMHVPFVARILAMAFIILALARPQSSNSWQNVTTEGIDIMLATDISGSMLAEDLKPNRLKAAINVATEFVSGRPTDRMGLVVFSAESFTQCPLTSDHAVLVNLFQRIDAIKLQDGTAIGMGLATAVARLKDSKAKSKVVILLTDGQNNAGEIAPETASNLAKTFGIRVYTIGVGTEGKAPYPVQTAFGMQYQYIDASIDEPLLRSIAESTGGRYFRATDNGKLKNIYNEIDLLEKTKLDIKEVSKKTEEYLRFALWAAFFLLLEGVVRYALLKKIP